MGERLDELDIVSVINEVLDGVKLLDGESVKEADTVALTEDDSEVRPDSVMIDESVYEAVIELLALSIDEAEYETISENENFPLRDADQLARGDFDGNTDLDTDAQADCETDDKAVREIRGDNDGEAVTDGERDTKDERVLVADCVTLPVELPLRRDERV